MIGRYESIHEEVDHVLEWLKVPQFVGKFPKSDRPFHATKVLRNYFSKLSSTLRLRLISAYLSDFLLFGYNLI